MLVAPPKEAKHSSRRVLSVGIYHGNVVDLLAPALDVENTVRQVVHHSARQRLLQLDQPASAPSSVFYSPRTDIMAPDLPPGPSRVIPSMEEKSCDYAYGSIYVRGRIVY